MAGDEGGFFGFSTDIDEVVGQVIAGYERAIAASEDFAARAKATGGSGGGVATGDMSQFETFNNQIKNFGADATKQSLQQLKDVAAQFKTAASQGKTTVNGQTLQQAISQISENVDKTLATKARSLESIRPTSISSESSGKMLQTAVTQLSESVNQVIKGLISQVNQVAREMGGLKGSPFGTRSAGFNQVPAQFAASQVVPSQQTPAQQAQQARVAAQAQAVVNSGKAQEAATVAAKAVTSVPPQQREMTQPTLQRMADVIANGPRVTGQPQEVAAVRQTLARSTVSMDSLPKGLQIQVADLANPNTSSAIRSGTSRATYNPDKDLGGRSIADGSGGRITVHPGAIDSTSFIHELGHAASNASQTSHSQLFAEENAGRRELLHGQEEAYADDFASEHYRNALGERQGVRTYAGGNTPNTSGGLLPADFWQGYNATRRTADDNAPKHTPLGPVVEPRSAEQQAQFEREQQLREIQNAPSSTQLQWSGGRLSPLPIAGGAQDDAVRAYAKLHPDYTQASVTPAFRPEDTLALARQMQPGLIEQMQRADYVPPKGSGASDESYLASVRQRHPGLIEQMQRADYDPNVSGERRGPNRESDEDFEKWLNGPGSLSGVTGGRGNGKPPGPPAPPATAPEPEPEKPLGADAEAARAKVLELFATIRQQAEEVASGIKAAGSGEPIQTQKIPAYATEENAANSRVIAQVGTEAKGLATSGEKASNKSSDEALFQAAQALRASAIELQKAGAAAFKAGAAAPGVLPSFKSQSEQAGATATKTTGAITEASLRADDLAAKLRAGTAVQVGRGSNSVVWDRDGSGQLRPNQMGMDNGRSTAVPITDQFKTQQAEKDLLNVTNRRTASGRKALGQEEGFVGEEKGAYDTFLKGFFGAGGRKRTGHASEIDSANPLAGFAETAGIVAKYELQGRAIQSMGGQVGAAVKDYAELNLATRMYNDVTGDANAATASYASSLENLSAVAGGNVVQAMQSATRGVVAFSGANDTAAQKRATGEQFVGQTTQYGVITGQDQKDSADQLIAAGQGFGVGADGLSRITNAIANAKESFGSDSSAVGQAMGELGSTAKAAGFTLEEFAQILGKIQSTTSDSGGTMTSNVGRILDQFQTGAGKGALASVGVSVTGTVKDELLSLAKVYPTLNVAQQQFVNTQLGGARALRDLMPLMGAAPQLQKAFGKALNDSGAASREYNATINSLSGQLKQMSQAFKNVGLDLARSGILTPLGIIMETMKLLVTTFDKGIQVIDNINGPFKAFGINAKDAAMSVLEVVAVLKVLSAARARLEVAGVSGGGLTGIVAGSIAHRRVTAGRDIRTNRLLTPEQADAQRKEQGTPTKGPKQAAEQEAAKSTTALSEANTQAATGIKTATDSRIAAEQALINSIREEIVARGGAVAATEVETAVVVKYSDGLLTDALAENVHRDTVIADAAALRAHAEMQAQQSFAGIRSLGRRAGSALGGLGSTASGPLGRAGGLLNRGIGRLTLNPVVTDAEGAVTGGGARAFTGGAAGLMSGAMIATIGAGIISSTHKGVDNQLAAERNLTKAVDTTGLQTSSDSLHTAADKLTKAADEQQKASGGLRGAATSMVESLMGGKIGPGRKTAEYLAKLDTDLAGTLDTIAKSGDSATSGLAQLVSFKSLDALNTSLTNLQNTGAGAASMLDAGEVALRHFSSAVGGGTEVLSAASIKAVAAIVGVGAAKEVSGIHDYTSTGGAFGTAQSGVVLRDASGKEVTPNTADGGAGYSAKGIRQDTSGKVNKEAQDTVTAVVSEYLTTRGAEKVDPKALKGLLVGALTKIPELSGKNIEDTSIVQDVANNAVANTIGTQRTYQGKGAKQIAPGDIGKSVAQLMATSGAYATTVQNLLLLGKPIANLSMSDSDANNINKLQDNVNAAAESYKKLKAIAEAPGAGWPAKTAAANALAAVGRAQKIKDDALDAVNKKNSVNAGGGSDLTNVPAALGAARLKLGEDRNIFNDAKNVVDSGEAQKGLKTAADKLAADQKAKAPKKTIDSDKAAVKKAQDAVDKVYNNLGQAMDDINADLVSVQQQELAWITQQATNKSNLEAVTDKVAQEGDTINGLTSQIGYLTKNGGDKTVIAGLKAQRQAAIEQQTLDKVAASNARAVTGQGTRKAVAAGAYGSDQVAVAADIQGLQIGDTLGQAQQAITNTGQAFNNVAQIEKGLKVHTQTYWDDFKAHQDAVYAEAQLAVQVQGDQAAAALDPRNSLGFLQAAYKELQDKIAVAQAFGDKDAVATLTRQAKENVHQQAVLGVDTSSAQRTAGIDPRNTTALATEDLRHAQESLNTQLPGTKEYADAQIAVAKAKLALAVANKDYANAVEAASVFPGSALGAAHSALDAAKRTLATDKVNTLQWFIDLAALKNAMAADAQALRDAAIEAAKTGQDITDPVQEAKNAVTAAAAKLAYDMKNDRSKTRKDDLNKDTNTLRSAAAAEDLAAFQQKLGFLQTDQQLYRITLPQYIAQLRQMRDNIKGNTIQARNMRNELDQALLAAQQQGAGQFNIGDIKMPTLYEARRQALLAGQMTSKDLANAGQNAINTGESYNNIFQPITDALGQIQTRGAVLQLTTLKSAIDALGSSTATSGASGGGTTNHIQINGADLVKVLAFLNQALGTAATNTVTPLSSRRV